MKRRTFISMMAVAAAAGVLTLSGCSSSSSINTAASASSADSAASADLLDTIKERGSITIAMEGNWMPWTYHDENDVLVGYDVEVAQAIADKLGVEANFVESDWDSLLAGLESGRFDIICNGVDITEERSESYNFTTPYAYNRTALAVRSDNEDIHSFEDLNGKKTANSIASTYMMLAEEYGAEVSGVDTLDETIQMLLAGRVDATLNAEMSFYDYLNAHPDANFKIVALTEDATQVAIPVRKGAENESLLNALNDAIDELRAEGTLTEISMKYFGSDISSPEV
jgi:cystine transport system substrate-binding protein